MAASLSQLGEPHVHQSRQAVIGDLVVAVERLTDPSLMTDSPWIDVVESVHHAEEVDHSGRPVPSRLDFAELFSLCRCGEGTCEMCAVDRPAIIRVLERDDSQAHRASSRVVSLTMPVALLL